MPTLTWEAPNDKDDKVQIDIHKIQLFPVLFFFCGPEFCEIASNLTGFERKIPQRT